MTTLVLRNVKNTSLSNDEVDANFLALAQELSSLTKNSNDWVANTPVVLGDILLSDDRFYLVTTAGTTGALKPTHTSGIAVNGTSGLQYVVPTAYTAKDVLDKIKSLDGAGSGLDSDFVRGFYPSITPPVGANKTSIVVRSSSGAIEGNLINSAINNCTIGLTNPGAANFSVVNAGTLNVAGTVNMIGTLNLTTINSTFANIGNHNFNTNNIEIGGNATGNRAANLDFRGDDVYTDYSLRISRDNTGQNAPSRLIHRGTGLLSVETPEGATLSLPNARIRNSSSGSVGARLLLQPSSSTSLLGDVAIDITGNSIRFSETSSPFKGATLDLSTCLTNVGSQILTTNATQTLLNKSATTLPNTDNSDRIATTAHVKSVTNSTMVAGIPVFPTSLRVGGTVLEIGSSQSTNVSAELQLHSSTNSTADAKITKNAGVNGSLEIRNEGTGGIKLISNGQTYHGLVQLVRRLITSQSTVAQVITNADTVVATATETFEIQITPRLSNSWFKIYIRWAGESNFPYNLIFNLRRNGVRINAPGTNQGSGLAVATISFQTSDFSSTPDMLSFTTVDTTGSVAGEVITYSLVAASTQLNNTVQMFTNRCVGNPSSTFNEIFSSEIIVEEIAQ